MTFIVPNVIFLFPVWFTNMASALGSSVTSVNLSEWKQFGKNENFRVLCGSLPKLRELRLRGWRELNDSGVTGLPAEKLHQKETIIVTSKEDKARLFIGSFKS